MQSGIKIICKKRFGQFLITEEPYYTINDTETKQLEWNKESFIPLQPNHPHKITVQFPYMQKKDCAAASIIVEVNPNETKVYEYKTPLIMTSSGTIKRKS